MVVLFFGDFMATHMEPTKNGIKEYTMGVTLSQIGRVIFRIHLYYNNHKIKKDNKVTKK